MSDLIAPIPIQPQFWDPVQGQRTTESSLDAQLLVVMRAILTELRILNQSIQAGFNLSDNLDQARQDPYFIDPTFNL